MESPGESPPVAVVTGAARGIGWAVVERLLRAGWAVVASDLPAPTERAFARHQDKRLLWQAADVTAEDDVVRLMAVAVEAFGHIDGLVNNAALTHVHRDWTSVGQSDWETVLAVNLSGVFRCCRIAYPHLRRSTRGRIVNIGSVTFATGQRRLVDYVSAKGGVVGLTRTLARELGADGVTVNVVSPGAIRTEAELEIFPDQAEAERHTLSVQAVQRRGEPADVASAVAFLLSEEAGFISGQDLHVDGGWVPS